MDWTLRLHWQHHDCRRGGNFKLAFSFELAFSSAVTPAVTPVAAGPLALQAQSQTHGHAGGTVTAVPATRLPCAARRRASAQRDSVQLRHGVVGDAAPTPTVMMVPVCRETATRIFWRKSNSDCCAAPVTPADHM